MRITLFSTLLILFLLAGCQSDNRPEGATISEGTTDQLPVVPVSEISHRTPLSPSSSLADLQSLSWQEAFATVSESIAFDPYVGVLRGAEGTLRAGRGNSLDQSILLAVSIHDDVAAYRFINGQLDPDQAGKLLKTLQPDVRVASHPNVDLEKYSMSSDVELVDIASNHYWLEIKETADSEWTALDPTFPSMSPGSVAGDAGRVFGSPSRSSFQQLQTVVNIQTPSGTKRLGAFGGAVSELAFKSFDIVMTGLPLYEEVEADPDEEVDKPAVGNPFGGMFGGGAPPKKEKEVEAHEPREYGPVIGTEVSLDLTFDGKTSSSPDYALLIADPETYIERIWIDFTLSVPGQDARTIERTLYEATEDNAVRGPVGIHRYDISIFNGPVSRSTFDELRDEWIESLDVESWSALQEGLASGNATVDDLDEALVVEGDAGRTLGRLVPLAFAYESDSLSASVARRGGVTMVHSVPRILISSLETRPEGDEVVSEINLDLRLDEVDAIPFEGMPVGSDNLFQRARGMQESSLEGEVLQSIMQSSVAVTTTVDLMRASQDQGIALTVLTPGDEAMIASITGLSRWDARRIRNTLASGDNVIIPARKVNMDGADRIGWWRVERRTGAFVGVMEGGEHQAMTQYTTTSVNEILSPAQGFLLGMLNGAVGTHVLLAAGMLKYGQYTQRLKEEVKAQLQYLNCVMCPEAKLEVSIGSSGGASVQIASCYEFELIKNQEVSAGVSKSIPFCDYYKKGVSCASSLILEGLTVSVEEEEAGGPSIDYTIPYDC